MSAQEVERLLELERENRALRASLGAIHFHAGRGSADKVELYAILHSIKIEAEERIPELRNMSKDQMGPQSSIATVMADFASICDADAFGKWLATPNRQLGNRSPHWQIKHGNLDLVLRVMEQITTGAHV